MIWVTARRIIAFVTNDKAFRDYPEMNFPRQSMCLYSEFSLSAYTAIPLFSQMAYPLPTAIFLDDVLPEPFQERTFWSSGSAAAGSDACECVAGVPAFKCAKSGAPTLNIMGACLKSLLTMLANLFDRMTTGLGHDHPPEKGGSVLGQVHTSTVHLAPLF